MSKKYVMIYPDGRGVTFEEYQRMQNNDGWHLNTKENRIKFKEYIVMFADGEGVLCFAELDDNGDISDKVRYEIPDQISLDRLINHGVAESLNASLMGFKLIRRLDHDYTIGHGKNCPNFPLQTPQPERQKCWKCNIEIVSIDHPSFLERWRKSSISYDYTE